MAWSLVGAWGGTQTNNFTGSATSGSRATTAGSIIVVGVTMANPANFTSVTDSVNAGAYTPLTNWQNLGGGDSIRLFFRVNAAGGSATVSVNTTGTGNFVVVCSVEWTPPAGTISGDKTQGAGASGTGVSLDSTSTATLSSADELVVGYGQVSAGSGTGTWTNGVGYTVEANIGAASSGATGCLEDKTVSANTAVSATMSVSGLVSPTSHECQVATLGVSPVGTFDQESYGSGLAKQKTTRPSPFRPGLAR